jgi:hypothetical protein
MPSIELTDEEHAALAAALRRLINEDRFPHAPRLDPLRFALAKLEAPPAANSRRKAGEVLGRAPMKKSFCPPMTLANMRSNGVRAVTATCEAYGHKADVIVAARCQKT